MPLSPCTSIGHYDVTVLIGEGGMGQVWQATDTQLNRQVALQILPDAFAADPERLARFTREAQILASLNHPNIAAIHGIEESEGTRALVLELVERSTLTGSPKVPFPLTKRCRSRVLTSPPPRRVQRRHPAAGWPSFPPPRRSNVSPPLTNSRTLRHRLPESRFSGCLQAETPLSY